MIDISFRTKLSFPNCNKNVKQVFQKRIPYLFGDDFFSNNHVSQIKKSVTLLRSIVLQKIFTGK